MPKDPLKRLKQLPKQIFLYAFWRPVNFYSDLGLNKYFAIPDWFPKYFISYGYYMLIEKLYKLGQIVRVNKSQHRELPNTKCIQAASKNSL